VEISFGVVFSRIFLSLWSSATVEIRFFGTCGVPTLESEISPEKKQIFWGWDVSTINPPIFGSGLDSWGTLCLTDVSMMDFRDQRRCASIVHCFLGNSKMSLFEMEFLALQRASAFSGFKWMQFGENPESQRTHK